MFKFLAGRLVQMAILFVAFLSIVWLLLQAMPGDISDTLVGNPDIPLAARLALRERLGLNLPLHEQYFAYITNFFRGEMGVSFSRYPQEVSAILWNALPRTLVLFLTATLFAYFLGWFPIGRFIDARLWQGSPYNANEVFGQMILSVLAVSALYILGRYLIGRYSDNLVTQARLNQVLGILAVGALIVFWWLRPEQQFVVDIARHTMLPVITLGLVAFGATMLLTRSAMLETLGEDYILTARAKGLPDT